MKADLTRLTFKAKKDFTKVLMQQGRVQLDSDWNEQLDIQESLDRTATRDIVGPCGVPNSGGGFAIAAESNDFSISPGRIYVSGLVVEFQPASVPFILTSAAATAPPQVKVAIWSPDSRDFAVGQFVTAYDEEAPATSAIPLTVTFADSTSNTLTLDSIPPGQTNLGTLFQAFALPRLRRNATYNYQPYYTDPGTTRSPGIYLAYLDVWERLRTPLEEPGTKEVALGGVDTAARTQLVWQVKLWPLPATLAPPPPAPPPSCLAVPNSPDWKNLIAAPTAWMSAQAIPQPTSTDPCIVPPQAGYRRLENQLYRIEIHTPGPAKTATFKWSRENGSVVTAWNVAQSSPNQLAVTTLGRDSVLGFASGQWVELTDDTFELQQKPGILAKLSDARMAPSGSILVLDPATPAIDFTQFTLNPKVRRWDQSDPTQITTNGDILVREGAPVNLEGGVQVIFQPTGKYNTGDYWLVPARTVTGNVEWPVDDNGSPIPQPPAGVAHHYCHLALLQFASNSWTLLDDCREKFPPMAALGMHVAATNWSNDDTFPIDVITKQGLQITLDNAPDPTSINSSTVIVELERPVGDQIGEFRIILDGAISLPPKGNVITWIPLAPTVFIQLVTGTTQMRIRVTLKGHYIWTKFGSNTYYLDGQSFGNAAVRSDGVTKRIALSLPTGNGNTASDFDSWLWMMAPPQLTLAALTVNPAAVLTLAGATGTVTLSAAAPTGGTVVTLASNNTGIAAVPPSVTVLAGTTSANFTITAGKTIGAATITATLGTSSQTASLNVIGLQSITLDPTTVGLGGSALGTVTFSAALPPEARATISIGATPNIVQLVPNQVVLAAGAASGIFRVNVLGTVTGFTLLEAKTTAGFAGAPAAPAAPGQPTATGTPAGAVPVVGGQVFSRQVVISASFGGITVTTRLTIEVLLR